MIVTKKGPVAADVPPGVLANDPGAAGSAGRDDSRDDRPGRDPGPDAARLRRLGFVYMPMGCDITRWTPPGAGRPRRAVADL